MRQPQSLEGTVWSGALFDAMPKDIRGPRINAFNGEHRARWKNDLQTCSRILTERSWRLVIVSKTTPTSPATLWSTSWGLAEFLSRFARSIQPMDCIKWSEIGLNNRGPRIWQCS